MDTKARGKRKTFNCLQCEQDYEAIATKNSKFCSRDCYMLNRRINAMSDEERKHANVLYQKKNKYGLSTNEYEQMVETANGICQICKIKVDRLFVDHCHDTGKVRGLLCNTCNAGIGMLKHSLPVLQNAMNYLMEY